MFILPKIKTPKPHQDDAFYFNIASKNIGKTVYSVYSCLLFITAYHCWDIITTIVILICGYIIDSFLHFKIKMREQISSTVNT